MMPTLESTYSERVKVKKPRKPYYTVFGMVIFVTKRDAQQWWLKGYLKGKQAGRSGK